VCTISLCNIVAIVMRLPADTHLERDFHMEGHLTQGLWDKESINHQSLVGDYMESLNTVQIWWNLKGLGSGSLRSG
jgi:hypothetical protein